jgi:uncharacterized protein YndB with AHSA1/START domain
MATVTETIDIDAPPDTVWATGGDVANVAEWVPAIAASRAEGDRRLCTFEGGGDAVERIIERSDADRFYVYEYLEGPLPLRSYRSRFSVEPAGDGSRVLWTSEFSAEAAESEPDLVTAISAIYRGALDELKRRMEKDRTD